MSSPGLRVHLYLDLSIFQCSLLQFWLTTLLLTIRIDQTYRNLVLSNCQLDNCIQCLSDGGIKSTAVLTFLTI